MEFAAQIFVFVIAIGSCILLAFGLVFLGRLLLVKTSLASDAELPKAAIILPIKGLDPDLKNCLLQLLRQDYPEYELRIVVHSADDPALSVINAAILESGKTNVHVEIFRSEFDPLQLQCSNSKTVQGIQGLCDSVELVAIAAGALITHPTWLRELLTPMVRDSRIGATYGNRWYMPREAQWGSLMRYIWSVAGAPVMYYGNMPWGACLGVRLSAIRKGNVLDAWSRILAIDAALPKMLAEQKMQVRFVSSLMMINRDECTVPFYMNFVQRQLTWLRVYHSRWPMVVVHAAMSVLLLLAVVAVPITALIVNEVRLAFIVAAVIFAFQTSLIAYIVTSDFVIRRTSSSYREFATEWWSWKAAIRLPWALLLTQVSHPVTVWRAAFEKYVTWRDLKLEIVGRNDIRNPSAVLHRTAEDALRSSADSRG